VITRRKQDAAAAAAATATTTGDSAAVAHSVLSPRLLIVVLEPHVAVSLVIVRMAAVVASACG
jgi:hypothetical protein